MTALEMVFAAVAVAALLVAHLALWQLGRARARNTALREVTTAQRQQLNEQWELLCEAWQAIAERNAAESEAKG